MACLTRTAGTFAFIHLLDLALFILTFTVVIIPLDLAVFTLAFTVVTVLLGLVGSSS